MKKIILAISIFLFTTTALTGCTGRATNIQQPSGKTDSTKTLDNKFDLKSVKAGDKIAGMNVTTVELQPDGNGNVYGYSGKIIFSGDVTVSGTYKVDKDELDGEYVRLLPDEKSKDKLPTFSGQKYFEIKLFDKSAMAEFEKTGAKGSFKLAVNEYGMAFEEGSLYNGIKVAKIIEINKEVQ